MDEALPLLEQAVKEAPDEGEPYLYRALVLVEKGKMDRALADFRRALEEAPGWHEAHYHYGDALLTLGRLEEAEPQLRRALECQGRIRAWANYRMGDLLRQRGNVKGAIAAYLESVRLDPQGSGHHAIGDLRLERGEPREALAAYERDLRHHPECYEARVNVATMYLDDDRPERAARHFAASLRYHPDDPRALRGLARARLAQGERWAALDALTRAVEIAPEETESTSLLLRALSHPCRPWVWPLGGGLGIGLLLGWIGGSLVARGRRGESS
jgi:tetratricopeptide (TPR) repeat protein